MVEREAVLRPEFILESVWRVSSISAMKAWTSTSVDCESMCWKRLSRSDTAGDAPLGLSLDEPNAEGLALGWGSVTCFMLSWYMRWIMRADVIRSSCWCFSSKASCSLCSLSCSPTETNRPTVEFKGPSSED